MKILLLNENPVVSRLVSLSAKKMSYDFEELNSYSDEITHCDIIIVDSDTQVDLSVLKDKCDRLIFLAPRNQKYEVEAQILQKPFLPTDLLAILSTQVVELDNISAIDNLFTNTENPYADINLDLDSLNLDDDADENISQKNEDLESIDTLSLDEEISLEEDKENIEEEINTDSLLNEENLEDLKETQEENTPDEEISLEEDKENIEEEINTDSLLNEEIGSRENEEEVLPIVEDTQINFDDLPSDAEFLGQEKESDDVDDFIPVIEEEELGEDGLEFDSNLSTQDQIKEELAQLDELDTLDKSENFEDGTKILEDFKNDAIIDEKDLGIEEQELDIPNISSISSLDDIKESDIQMALGEAVTSPVVDEVKVDAKEIAEDDQIMSELTHSIAGAITSSINDDTLKAALKGMNMNINIKISFEDKN